MWRNKEKDKANAAAQQRFFAVVTTIQEPTGSVQRMARLLGPSGRMIAVGDRKGPETFSAPGTRFYSLAEQMDLPLQMAKLLPEGHYARKNLAYLLAMRESATSIYEFDDDNSPAENWIMRKYEAQAQAVTERPWVNVFRIFTKQNIWPRGFPLDKVQDASAWEHDRRSPLAPRKAPIQQCLSNGAADVDAIWRLTVGGNTQFEHGQSVYLPPHSWCPFNSQNTWWWPLAYPLMYLPSNCTFRMTDIWRGFVAQRCLWELNCGLVFHAADSIQHRNAHDLMTDFMDEVPGYLLNQSIVDALMKVELKKGEDQAGANLLRCYEVLVAREFIDAAELKLVKAWLEDCAAVNKPAEPATADAGDNK